MTIGKRLKELRKKAGLTQAQVGALFTPAIERAAVAQWEGDKTRPDQDRLETLARAYHTSIDHILKGRGSASHNVEPSPAEFGKVPIITWAQASNFATVLDKLHSQGGAAEWAATTVSIHKHTYALRVRGDSMVSPSGEPTFADGQVIIVEPDAINAPDALVGQFVIVLRSGDDEATFKQLVRDSGRFYLKPLNPQYPMLQFEKNDVICGVVRQKVVTFF